jgi:hypothetical protein
MFLNSCSNIDLKNIQPLTVCLASKKGVSVGSYTQLCQLTEHTFMRIEVRRTKKKHCGIHYMDQEQKVYPFNALPKRPMGCQDMNPHNSSILKVFNSNTNIQIGDVSQVFYSTSYSSKSRQEEDSEKQLWIERADNKRIKKLLDENQTMQPIIIDHNNKFTGKKSNDECNQARLEPSFLNGLSRVLSGLNATMTRNVISATMAHLIPSNGGSCFVFSHDFSDLLVGQMEATLEGQDMNVRIRANKLLEGQFKSWSDSLADDYIHRPVNDKFEAMSFYEMTDVTKRYSNITKEEQRQI